MGAVFCMPHIVCSGKLQLNSRPGCCGSWSCAMEWVVSCGRLGSPSEEASFSGINEHNIDFIAQNLLPWRSVAGASLCSTASSVSSQMILWWSIPKRNGEDVGEEKEKSQFSQPHWWLPYGSGENNSGALNLTTVNTLLLLWHHHLHVLPVLTFSLSLWGT